uniref:Ribosome-binding factor A n=1 Tax=Elaeophora elaphi TaxID=1147741 RepID=A0A0R3S0P8_9BILA
MGIGGTFANTIRKALNSVVPKKLWPKIKKRLRFAFNQRGEVTLEVLGAVPLAARQPLISVLNSVQSQYRISSENRISGIRLPVMCGVELERPSLSYIDHAIVVDTDFSYDLPRFIRKFKVYLNAEIARARKKERMESEEDY